MAQAIFRTHRGTERDLRLGKVFAYRVVEDAIDLSAAYLARPIHVYTVSLDGTVAELGEDEMRGLELTCQTWRQLERDAVGGLLAPQASREQAPDVPLPEPYLKHGADQINLNGYSQATAYG